MNEEIPIAYCESLTNDISILEKCQGNGACVRKEVNKCIQVEKYTCDPNYKKGKSINQLLRDKGIRIQLIIATQHTDYANLEAVTKVDYIRAETKEGYPFVIYLDAKGYVKTEESMTEITIIQDGKFVSESQLKSAYQISVPNVRGVALFTPGGITVAMYNQKMQMIVYNHAYLHVDKDDDENMDIAVPYPVLPLSEILLYDANVSDRVQFILDPLRNLFKERAVKIMKDVCKEVDFLPKNLRNFSDAVFVKIEELQGSIQKLRDIYMENSCLECSCDIKLKCRCKEQKEKIMEITRYNLGVRERYINELLALHSVVSMKTRVVNSVLEELMKAEKILNERYCDFDMTYVDDSADWAAEFE